MTQPCTAAASAVTAMLHCNASLQQFVMGQRLSVAPCNATCIKDTEYRACAYSDYGQVICSSDCALQPHTSQRAV